MVSGMKNQKWITNEAPLWQGPWGQAEAGACTPGGPQLAVASLAVQLAAVPKGLLLSTAASGEARLHGHIPQRPPFSPHQGLSGSWKAFHVPSLGGKSTHTFTYTHPTKSWPTLPAQPPPSPQDYLCPSHAPWREPSCPHAPQGATTYQLSVTVPLHIMVPKPVPTVRTFSWCGHRRDLGCLSCPALLPALTPSWWLLHITPCHSVGEALRAHWANAARAAATGLLC